MSWMPSHKLAKWLLISGLIAFLASRTASSVVDVDLWHELSLAREVVQLGNVPWEDHFAFTPKLKIVVHHEWGAGMIAYGLTQCFGSAGILFAKFALIGGLAAVCWCNAQRRGASVIATAIVAALAIVLSDYSFATVRAQMYSYLLTALLLWGFDRDRAGDRRWLIALLALFPLWVNLHGGCLVGAGLLGAHWLEQLLRRQPHRHLLVAGLSLVPLWLLNPWGYHYLEYLARAIAMPRPRVAEWAPLWAEGKLHHLLSFMVSVGLAWLVLNEGRWRRIPGILLLLATGLAALKSHRFLAFYAVVYACYLPDQLTRTSLGKDLRRWWWKYQRAWCAVFGVATVVLFTRAASYEPWHLRVPAQPIPGQGDHIVYPVGAVDYLAENRFQGNVMVPYDWGSYVMWKLGPAVQISFDSRYEVAYPDWRLEEDFQLHEARKGWEDILKKYPADIVLIPTRLTLVNALSSAADWKLIYRDPQFAMFARESVDLPLLERAIAADGKFP